LQRKQSQYVNGYATSIVTDAVGFDAVGRRATRYAPFAARLPDLTQYETPSSSSRATVWQYDLLDRIVRITNPDRTFQRLDYTAAHQVTSTDENYTKGKYPGSRVVERIDAIGRRLSIQRFACNAPAGT